jgi:hypothetical protein
MVLGVAAFATTGLCMESALAKAKSQDGLLLLIKREGASLYVLLQKG